jgi:hypothetical protein
VGGARRKIREKIVGEEVVGEKVFGDKIGDPRRHP